MCKHVYHLACLDPPLSIKPRMGYSWACAPCSKKHHEEVEKYQETGIKTKLGNTEKTFLTKAAKGKAREVVLSTQGSSMKLTNGWPYRYFGVNTEQDSILGEISSRLAQLARYTDGMTSLDPHDSLYPRASTASRVALAQSDMC